MEPRGHPVVHLGGIGRLGVYACGPGGQRRPVPMDPGAGAPAAPESTTAGRGRGRDRGRGPKGEPTPGAVARRGDHLCPAHSDSRGRTPSDRPGCTRFPNRRGRLSIIYRMAGRDIWDHRPTARLPDRLSRIHTTLRPAVPAAWGKRRQVLEVPCVFKDFRGPRCSPPGRWGAQGTGGLTACLSTDCPDGSADSPPEARRSERLQRPPSL